MPNKTIFVAVLGAVFMLAPFAIDMYLPALPTIAGAALALVATHSLHFTTFPVEGATNA